MHLAKIALDNGGSIHPLIIPSNLTNGTGLMNPSIYLDGDKLLVNIRHVNYTFYHSEKKIFQHQFGPLTYVHPEHDMHLRTDNYYCELDEHFNITRFNKVDMSKFDTYEPMWDFVGLEDARLFRWDDKLYMSGVRRDTTTNGQGRMELSEIEVGVDSVKEISRVRIEAPNNPDSYCEKNWMPIIDNPYHYVKWGNPTEVVEVFPETSSSKTVYSGNHIQLPNDLRGGSHVIPYGDLHFATTHEVYFDKSEVGRKDGHYKHRFIVWKKDWNIFAYSREFSFMDAHVEFCTGMVQLGNDFLFSFGFQDNAAYILKVPQNVIVDFINGKY
jgi:hypothetical protein